MRSQYRLALLLGLASLVASGCVISIRIPSSPGLPGAFSGNINTIIAATAAAAQTQTAELLGPSLTPTWTPLPTHTPSLTPSPTPTFIFIIGGGHTPVNSATPGGGVITWTNTPSPSDRLDGCILLSQTPADGTHFAARASFTVAWKVENTGSAVWRKNTVDFAYYSGTRMYTKQVYSLPVDIPRWEYVTLKVPMTAPRNSGTYRTVWSLRRGQVAYPNPSTDTFCHVDLTIRVP